MTRSRDDYRRPDAFGTTHVAEFGIVPNERERVVHPPFDVPKWLFRMMRAGASAADIVATLRERLLNGESDLHEAQHVLNDVGRRVGGGEVLKRFVTQEIVSDLGRKR